VNAEDLAFVADALLALCDSSQQAPFYTTKGFRLKLLRDQRREPIYAHLAFARGDDPLLKVECSEVFESAELTDRQARRSLAAARRLDLRRDRRGDRTHEAGGAKCVSRRNQEDCPCFLRLPLQRTE
jgi:hypothetical protein